MFSEFEEDEEDVEPDIDTKRHRNSALIFGFFRRSLKQCIIDDIARICLLYYVQDICTIYNRIQTLKGILHISSLHYKINNYRTNVICTSFTRGHLQMHIPIQLHIL